MEEGTVLVAEAIVAAVDFLVFRTYEEGSLGGDILAAVADYSAVVVVPVTGSGIQATRSNFHPSLLCFRRRRLSVSVPHPIVLTELFAVSERAVFHVISLTSTCLTDNLSSIYGFACYGIASGHKCFPCAVSKPQQIVPRFPNRLPQSRLVLFR